MLTRFALLNKALEEKKYDDAGNGVYESFRAGYRMFNWLFAHNLFLSSKEYSFRDQIVLLKTFLQTGAQLNLRTKKFSFGNHHTKGLSSLFQISILFPEIKGTDQWLNHSVEQLQQHLQKEVNSDGFQFERSVHYHTGDIDNYFYVYQLARINKLKLPDEFISKLKSMFEALIKIAQPDGTLPVLQDDTDEPWSEFNNMKSVMTLGAILFNDKTFRYFSSDDIPEDKYWLIKPEDAKIIYDEKGILPDIGAASLDETGYYVMRNGWLEDSEYMILSAGLSNEKPDHQHGDMLGVEAYANGNEILPNYQVRYFLSDLNFFKNSWTKNVALVDSIPQGRYWKPNEGGTGFGKWLFLPKPKTILWRTEKHFDYFSGTHNGYDSLGVKYFREMFFIKSGFWIVRDFFQSTGEHNYQQVWQGHYSKEENNSHLISTFRNGSGMDIVQLEKNPPKVYYGSFRGKGNAVFETKHSGDFIYMTLLFPFKDFGGRLELNENSDSIKVKNTFLIKNPGNKILETGGIKSNAKYILQIDKDDLIFFDVNNIRIENSEISFSENTSFEIKPGGNGYTLLCLSFKNVSLEKNEFSKIKIIRNNSETKQKDIKLISPGDLIILNN